MLQIQVLGLILFLFGISVEAQDTQYYQGRPGLRAGGNNGVIKSLEARISALESIIKEYEAKEVRLQERGEALELRSLELTKLAQDNERRTQERLNALDKREQEITAYQNQVFREQDKREQEIEKAGREKERYLDAQQRSFEQAQRNL